MDCCLFLNLVWDSDFAITSHQSACCISLTSIRSWYCILALSSEAARRQVEEHQTSAAVIATGSTITNQVATASGDGKNAAQSTSDRVGSTASTSAVSPNSDWLAPKIAEVFRMDPTDNTAQPRTLIVVALSHSPEAQCPITSSSTSVDIDEAMDVVQRKLRWATTELDRACSVEGSSQTCQLIKVCAETLEVLHRIQSKSTHPKPTD